MWVRVVRLVKKKLRSTRRQEKESDKKLDLAMRGEKEVKNTIKKATWFMDAPLLDKKSRESMVKFLKRKKPTLPTYRP